MNTRGWRLMRTLDDEKWMGVGILVWVPRRSRPPSRCVFAVVKMPEGFLYWGPDAAAEPFPHKPTYWRPMPAPPTRRTR